MQRRHRGAFDAAIAGLRYGCVCVNVPTLVGFAITALPWGAFPGGTPADVGSGIGTVHNTLLFDRPQKAVLHGPWCALGAACGPRRHPLPPPRNAPLTRPAPAPPHKPPKQPAAPPPRRYVPKQFWVASNTAAAEVVASAFGFIQSEGGPAGLGHALSAAFKDLRG